MKLFILLLHMFTCAIYTQAQDFSTISLDHWEVLLEQSSFDNVKDLMASIEYSLLNENVTDTRAVFTFSDESAHKIMFIYENKKLTLLGSSIFIMSLPYLYTNLKEDGYVITAKEKVKYNDQKVEAKTWEKPNSTYQFIFVNTSSFESLMQIKIKDSATVSNVEPDDFPLVQNLLNKIEGKKFEENMTDQEMISQSVSINTFTKNSKVIHSQKNFKSVYSGINWNNFERVDIYSLKNEDKYLQCTFYFYEDIQYSSLDENGKEYATGYTDKFSCFIYAKDKEAFLKIVKDWENSRN